MAEATAMAAVVVNVISVADDETNRDDDVDVEMTTTTSRINDKMIDNIPTTTVNTTATSNATTNGKTAYLIPILRRTKSVMNDL